MEAANLHHPLLRPVNLDLRRGIGPEQAAVLAVIMNPSVRADRDRRGLAHAQLIQAGILPNPSLTVTGDKVTGGNTKGTVSAYGFTANWDVTSLITRNARLRAARANSKSIDLDVAWVEWQASQAARIAVFKLLALKTELARAREVEAGQQATADMLTKAVDLHAKTTVDLGIAEASLADAQAARQALDQDVAKQEIELKRAVGLPTTTSLTLRNDLALPTHLEPPSQESLLTDLRKARLDLMALELGYQSQGETLRAAILAQFPKLGFSMGRASDLTNVHTLGLGFTVDIPLFDRNQGAIGTERATRQKLFDEYNARVFQARTDIAVASSDISALNRQIATDQRSLPALENLVNSAQIAFQNGNADALTYFQARNNLFLKQLQIVKLQELLLESAIGLEIASGRYLPTTTFANSRSR